MILTQLLVLSSNQYGSGLTVGVSLFLYSFLNSSSVRCTPVVLSGVALYIYREDAILPFKSF